MTYPAGRRGRRRTTYGDGHAVRRSPDTPGREP